MSDESGRQRFLRACGLPSTATEEGFAAAARVLEGISDAFVFLDREWRYVYLNARAGQLFGRKPEDLVGKHIWTEFPEGVGQPFHLAYERAMRDNVAIQIEEFYPPWGRWFANRIQPSPDGLAIFFQDVTERRQADEERERMHAQIREEERMRAHAERMAHLGFCRLDIETSRVDWSDELRRIYGLAEGERESSLGGYLSHVHVDDRERVRTAIENAIAEKGGFTLYKRIVRPDGSVRTMHSSGQVTLSPEGKAVGMLGTCVDVTTLIETTQALRQNQEWLARALEGGRMGLWDWDLATNGVRWSDGVERLFGLAPGVFDETYEGYIRAVHSDDRA